MPIDPTKLNKPNSPKQKPQSQHNNNTQAAKSALTTTTQQVVTNAQRTVGNAQAYLDRLEGQRDEALEKLSDRAAYLLDERVFVAELLDRTSEKLGALEGSLENPFEAVAIDVPIFSRGDQNLLGTIS